MRLSARFLLVVVAAVGLLAGCEAPQPTPMYPDLRFNNEPPIGLAAARVEIRDDYRPPYGPPHVEQSFPVPLARAAANWAQDRLRADGQSGRAVFIIRTASIVEVPLPVARGVQGAFTTQPSERYDMVLQVTLQIVDANGLAIRTANVTATRSQSILNDASLNQRNRVWYDMTANLMADFNRQMTTEIRHTFPPYVAP